MGRILRSAQAVIHICPLRQEAICALSLMLDYGCKQVQDYVFLIAGGPPLRAGWSLWLGHHGARGGRLATPLRRTDAASNRGPAIAGTGAAILQAAVHR